MTSITARLGLTITLLATTAATVFAQPSGNWQIDTYAQGERAYYAMEDIKREFNMSTDNFDVMKQALMRLRDWGFSSGIDVSAIDTNVAPTVTEGRECIEVMNENGEWEWRCQTNGTYSQCYGTTQINSMTELRSAVSFASWLYGSAAIYATVIGQPHFGVMFGAFSQGFALWEWKIERQMTEMEKQRCI